MPSTPDLDTLFDRLAQLTPSQSSLLRRIASHAEPVTVAGLAGEAELHTSSVREVLDALVEMGLVRSVKLPSQGRGRPALGYAANTEPQVLSPTSMIRMLTDCYFEWLHMTGINRSEAAEQIGALMATRALGLMHVPIHHAPALGFDLDAHMNKIRMFFTTFGMGASPHPSVTTAFVLNACPFDDSEVPSSVALTLRRGFVEKAIELTACGMVETRFEPDEKDSRRCTVLLSTKTVDADEETMITIKYFGGSADAAGCSSERTEFRHRLGEVLADAVERHPALEPIIAVSTFLVGQRPAERDRELGPDSTVEVLPPFAGG